VDLLLHPPNTVQVQTTIRVRQNRPHRHRHPRPTNIQAVPKDHHQVCHK
jgi:hypothetical protein